MKRKRYPKFSITRLRIDVPTAEPIRTINFTDLDRHQSGHHRVRLNEANSRYICKKCSMEFTLEGQQIETDTH